MNIRANEGQDINFNSLEQAGAQEKAGRRSQRQNRRNSIFAGDLNMQRDAVTQRRQLARQKALKIINDAWKGDRKADQSIEEYQALAEEQRKELQLNRDKMTECRNRKENLREQYGVEADSQEQKDLELLERSYYPGDYDGEFTEEEEQRIQELRNPQGGSLTEYQKKCLEIDGEEQVFKNRADDAGALIEAYNGAVTSMKVERLKFHKMTDAQNNAKKVMEQAGKDIQGMIVDEARDHVDETYEEQREKAEKKAEEKEAQEEKIELRREQRELMEARIEEAQEESRDAEEAGKERERDARDEAAFLKDMAEAGMNVAGAGDAVKAEIKDMLNKMKLIEADIKGIEVDEEI